MSNKKEAFRTSIGGQAVIEGIMMRGVDKAAIVVRGQDGTLHNELWQLAKPRKKTNFLAWPFIRGLVGFVSSMKLGYKALNYSASFFAEPDENTEPSKLDAWLDKHEKANSVVTIVAMLLGLVLAFALFTVLPTFLGGLLQRLTSIPVLVRGLFEGVLRVLIFLLYLLFVSRLKDIKRVFAYHGAEHKTIACYEAGSQLTIDNVRGFTRFHPRCGTSFLFNVVIISILVFCWVTWSSMWIRMALRLALLPFVVMIAYEFNRWAGRHDGAISRALRAPGLWMQRLTTQEPDDSMIEVAITALDMVRPEVAGSDAWGE